MSRVRTEGAVAGIETTSVDAAREEEDNECT